MQGDTQVILLILCFFFGSLLTLFLDSKPMENALIAITGFLATLAAAFFGSKHAFKLQSEENDRKTKAEQVASANRAIFQLIKLHNEFAAVRRESFRPLLESPTRHLEIKPLLTYPEPISIDFDSLSFLFFSSNPNLLQELAAYQLQSNGTINTLIERGKLHVKAQEIAEEVRDKNTDIVKAEDIENALGMKDTLLLRSFTDHSIYGANEVIEGAQEFIKELGSIFRELFPGHQLITMKKPSPAPQPPV